MVTNPTFKRALSLSLSFALIFVSLLSTPRATFACVPGGLSAVFSYVHHPDIPFDRYARGEIGVVQQTYARSYLFAAYRDIAGIGFNTNEQKELVALWDERLRYESRSEDTEKWIAAWTEKRKTVPDLPKPPDINIYREVNRKDEYINYINCTQDAFQSAAKRLQTQITKYGATNDRVKLWVDAQDRVFANCHEGQNIIEAPPADSDAPIIAERMYQAASALFYAARFDDAQKAFEIIGRDVKSPYQQTAKYLIARALIRKATLAPATDTATRNTSFAQAGEQLRKILNDARAAQFHQSARGLLNYVRLRANTEARLHELAHDILNRNSEATLRQDIWDYTFALDSVLTQFDGGDGGRKFAQIPESARANDVSDWITTLQATDAESTVHAVSRWRQTEKPTWLVAAISKAQKDNSQTPLLLAAADKIPVSSPAYPTVAFHAARLLIAVGSLDEARRRLDVLLSEKRAILPPSAINQFLNLRLPLARTLEDFLRDAQRPPAAYTSDFDGREIPDDPKDLDLKRYANGGNVYFDVDGANILNSRLPVTVLRDAATVQILSTGLRRDVTQAAWVRAVLLDNRQLASELALPLARLMPEIKSQLQAYVSAASDEDARYTALYTLLKFPGIEPFVDANLGRITPTAEIDSFRDNWWCDTSVTLKRFTASPEETVDKQKAQLVRMPSPVFLTPEQKQTARKELSQLAALGTAPNYLCRQAIEWARVHPDDPRVPEALHLAVKSTRYGCGDAETGKFSKAAYDVLHKQYPNSEWTKKTKYWYKGGE
ncbi:MAG: hypothetical protein NVSMB56_00760 [Pyrinomonadaceae bacterium]